MITNKIFNEMGITVTSAQLNAFNLYTEMLISWNKKFNLTAITNMDDIAVKHFADSLVLLSFIENTQASFVDIGAGAGFPGVPLKIMLPDLQLTLLEATSKKVLFLEALISELKLTNTKCINARAEELKYSDARFHYAAARAVAPLNKLAKFSLPLVSPGGVFFALKGGECAEETEKAAAVILKNGGSHPEIKHFVLPKGYKRSVVVIKKI